MNEKKSKGSTFLNESSNTRRFRKKKKRVVAKGCVLIIQNCSLGNAARRECRREGGPGCSARKRCDATTAFPRGKRRRNDILREVCGVYKKKREREKIPNVSARHLVTRFISLSSLCDYMYRPLHIGRDEIVVALL